MPIVKVEHKETYNGNFCPRCNAITLQQELEIHDIIDIKGYQCRICKTIIIRNLDSLFKKFMEELKKDEYKSSKM